LFFATRPTWGGGHVWGPRHLTPLLPVMMLLLAHLIDTADFRSVRMRVWQSVALAAGILIQIPNLLLYPRTYIGPMITSGRLRWEEIYFVPNRSPIIRNWIILKDSLISFRTGEPLFLYPVRVMRGTTEVLEPVYCPDFADAWDSWINVIRRAGYMDVLAVKIAVFTIVALLVCAAVFSAWAIRKQLRETDEQE